MLGRLSNSESLRDLIDVLEAHHPKLKRLELMNDLAITVTGVWLSDNSAFFHVVSFFEFQEGKIAVLSESWGEDGIVPQWRLDKYIGRPIKNKNHVC